MTDQSPDQPSNEEGEPTTSAAEGGEIEEPARHDATEEVTGSGAPEALKAQEPPTAPAAPASSELAAAPELGQRRITRHTTTSTTRTQTTTDEQIVETVAVAPPVWAAPAGEHPRPVG